MLRRIELACAAVLLVAVVLLVGIAAATRAMGSPIIWSIEVAQLLFLWLCVIAIDVGLQQERHFGIGIVMDNLPPSGRKALQIFNIVVLMGLLVYLLQFAWKNMILMHPRLDGALQLPGSWFHASMVVGFVLLIRTLAVKLFVTIRNEAAP